jgi:hypothetical protein
MVLKFLAISVEVSFSTSLQLRFIKSYLPLMTKCPISEITPMSYRKLVHLRASFHNENFYTSKKAIHSALEKWLSICCQNAQVKSYQHLNSNDPIILALIFHMRNCSVIFGFNFSLCNVPFWKTLHWSTWNVWFV